MICAPTEFEVDPTSTALMVVPNVQMAFLLKSPFVACANIVACFFAKNLLTSRAFHRGKIVQDTGAGLGA